MYDYCLFSNDVLQVYIIALISDRKYNQFRPVLDAYIESFGFTMAYKYVVFTFYLSLVFILAKCLKFGTSNESD